MLACSRMIVRAKRMLLPARRAVASGYSQHLMAARSFVTASPPLLGPHPFPSPAPHADFEPGRFEAENRLKGCKNVINFFETKWLKSAVFNPNVIFVVAEDTETNEILGTASVLLDYSAQSDLCGEFGRLVVHPDARGRGIGNILMEERLKLAAKYLHVAVVENRCVHPRSQAVSARAGFHCVGFLPESHLLGDPPRESVALWAQFFGDGLHLRDPNARLIPEVADIAFLALRNCHLETDVAVDDVSPAYPLCDQEHHIIEDVTADALPYSLLRLERGRVVDREVFGPAQLHFGFAKLEATHAHYVIAYKKLADGSKGPITGAVGYIHEPIEKKMRVFELLSVNNISTRLVLESLVVDKVAELGTEYVEVDVSSQAPRMQRTLLELGFVPAAYIPSMAFTDTKRVDVVKMIKLLAKFDLGPLCTVGETKEMMDEVVSQLRAQPRKEAIVASMEGLSLFKGMNEEQGRTLGSIADVMGFKAGEKVFSTGDPADSMYIILRGSCQIIGPPTAEKPFGLPLLHLRAGQLLSERTFLNNTPHEGSAVACGAGVDASSDPDADVLVLAEFSRHNMDQLLRRRPDIGMLVYKNLAHDIGEKLHHGNIRAVAEMAASIPCQD